MELPDAFASGREHAGVLFAGIDLYAGVVQDIGCCCRGFVPLAHIQIYS